MGRKDMVGLRDESNARADRAPRTWVRDSGLAEKAKDF